MEIFKSGYKPDPRDPRDKTTNNLRFLAEMTKLTASLNNEYRIPEYTPISDQGRLSTCVANAVCDALEILIGVEDPRRVVQLSRLMNYYNARSYSRDTDKDEGTYIRYAVDSLKRLGVCPESDWGYDPSRVNVQPPIRAYQKSLDNKINSYFRVDGVGTTRCDVVEQAIRANHPVIFAAPVSNEFTRHFVADNTVWNLPTNYVGYHAMIVVGVRRASSGRQFLVRNSWSSNWGDRGHCWFSEQYMGSQDVNDMWMLTRAPTLLF
jgi:C1A family cysteine protease